jgi:prepilin-type N-terminal cleavage/methylation domain-containing protein
MTRTDRLAPTTRFGSEGGFTLIEALVAMVVLAVGIISVANLMVVAARSNSVGTQGTAAATIASQEMERLTAISYNALPVGGDITADVAGFNSDTDVPGVGIIHTRWQVTGVANQTRLITVRSEGTGALSGARSRAEFTTIRSCTNVPIGCPPAP